MSPMKHHTPQVAYVTLDNFFDEYRGKEGLDNLLSRTAGFEQALERHGHDWQRPSADEAVLVRAGKSSEDSPVVLDAAWAERLREDIRRAIALDASVGIASTRLAARIASRVARPRGLLILLPGYEDRFISSVRLDELDELRPTQAAALHRHGIETLGGLAQLPREEARTLLGPEASGLLDLVRGSEGEDTRSRETRLEHGVSSLCRRAAKKLAGLGCGARGIELELAYQDGVSFKRYRLAPHPIAATSELRGEAHQLLALFPKRKEPIAGLSLTFTGLILRPGRLPLFPGPPVRDVCVRIGRYWETTRAPSGPTPQRPGEDDPVFPS